MFKKDSSSYISLIKDYTLIFVGTILIAAAVTVFYDPNKVVTGGVSGLCIITASYLKDFYNVDVSLSLLSILYNLPLLIVGFFVLGKNFIWRTLVATVLLSVSLAITAYFPEYHGDYFIVSVFGGVITGIGVGFTIRALATTGGSDLFATIVHKLNKRISIATAMFAFDAVVILSGLLIFGVECALYAIISVFIASKVMDSILEGMNFSIGVFIISKESQKIAQDIMTTLDRGVTGLNGKGMFTGNTTNVLLCIVSKKEIQAVKKIVKENDGSAFMFITDVRETLGEGFSAE